MLIILELPFLRCNCHLSCVMRKPTLCICENKNADQLRGNREADQRLCFRYLDRTIPLLPKYKILKPLAISSGCTARFVSDLVRIHIVGFLMSGSFFDVLTI